MVSINIFAHCRRKHRKYFFLLLSIIKPPHLSSHPLWKLTLLPHQLYPRRSIENFSFISFRWVSWHLILLRGSTRTRHKGNRRKRGTRQNILRLFLTFVCNCARDTGVEHETSFSGQLHQTAPGLRLSCRLYETIIEINFSRLSVDHLSL